MSNLTSPWWPQLFTRSLRRKSAVCPVTEVEQLERRQVLTRGAMLSPAGDAAALIVDDAVAAGPVASAGRSLKSDAPHGARKVEVIDIKQWQGTWNVSTDIPFLGSGVLTIQQLSPKKFETTNTGMGGNQFYAFKANGDDTLHFKIKGTDLAGKPKLVGFQVTLDQLSLSSFSGIAKVSGGDQHSISAVRQQGTGPSSSEIAIKFGKQKEEVKQGEFHLIFIVANLGTAPIPEGGVRVQVLVTGQNVSQSTYQSSSGLVSAVASSPGEGQLLVTCTVRALTSSTDNFALGDIELDVLSDLQITVTALDADGSTLPSIAQVSESVSVTVKTQ